MIIFHMFSPRRFQKSDTMLVIHSPIIIKKYSARDRARIEPALGVEEGHRVVTFSKTLQILINCAGPVEPVG